MVVAAPEDLDRLDALVSGHQVAETRWQAAAEHDTAVLALRGAAQREARARIRIERNRLRDNGTHRVTRWQALAPALRAELDKRGQYRPWNSVPEGAQQAGQALGGVGPHQGAAGPPRGSV